MGFGKLNMDKWGEFRRNYIKQNIEMSREIREALVISLLKELTTSDIRLYNASLHDLFSVIDTIIHPEYDKAGINSRSVFFRQIRKINPVVFHNVCNFIYDGDLVCKNCKCPGYEHFYEDGPECGKLEIKELK